MPETAKRIDPSSRRVDGSIDDRITGKDPNRHYILANPNDEDTGVPAMEELGFEVELYRKDGPRARGAKTAALGSPVLVRKQYLMSCPMDEHIQRIQEGQARADALAASIRRPGGVDGLPNVTRGPVVVHENVEEVLNVRSV